MFKSLKTPVYFGFLLVLLMVVLFSSQILSTYYSEYQHYQKAKKMLPFAAQIEQLVGSLAVERDLQDLAQSKPVHHHNKFKYFSQQFAEARVHTDSLLLKSQVIQTLQTRGANFKSLANPLQNLAKLRQTKHSFQAYTDIIQQLINLHQQILNQAMLPLSNSGLLMDMNDLNALIQLKESAGEERGLMMQVLLSRTLDTGHYFKLSGLVQMQGKALKQLNSSLLYRRQSTFMNSKTEDPLLNQLFQTLHSHQYTAFTQLRQQRKEQFQLQLKMLKLLSTVGYTGYIHHFKNYILRQKPIDYQRAKQAYANLNTLVNNMQMLPLTEQQKKEIQVIQHTFALYDQQLDKSKQMFAKGVSVIAVDNKVKIDDADAKTAIEQLKYFHTTVLPKIWWQQATQRMAFIDKSQQFFIHNIEREVQEHLEKLQYQVYFVLAGLLLLILLTVFLTRYLFKRTQQIIELSNGLNQMSQNRKFKTLPVHGKDEVASLSDSFNHLIEERKVYEHELWEKSNLDPLTQLPNRAHLQELLAIFIRNHQRQKNKLGVLFVDLDGFKNVNDTKGHHIGDKLLQTVAERLKSSIRTSDIAARLGGDEFIILLTHLENTQDMEMIASKIIHSLAEPMVLSDNLTLKISASAGMTVFPEDGDNASSLLVNADLAMYAAKAKGKNCYAFYQQNLSHNLTFKQQISEALHKAVENGHPEEHGFFLTYQPIVNTEQKLEHFEALIRWNHPELGFLPPDKFIGIAETTQTIIPLGDWIIREVARQLTQWQQMFDDALHVSINLSPIQSENGFASVHQVLDELKQQNFALDSLDFEITESLLMQDSKMICGALEKIRAYGCKIYLDDFGTGYSSLSYLKFFPMDVLKIDRSFIIDLIEDTQDQELVKTILSIAKVLDMEVVAEGVETQEQFNYLKAHQCDFIQGYWISKPLNGKDATAFLNGLK